MLRGLDAADPDTGEDERRQEEPRVRKDGGECCVRDEEGQDAAEKDIPRAVAAESVGNLSGGHR